jgi:hypothetical protein
MSKLRQGGAASRPKNKEQKKVELTERGGDRTRHTLRPQEVEGLYQVIKLPSGQFLKGLVRGAGIEPARPTAKGF